MHHHVALPGNGPALILPALGGKCRFGHIKRQPVNFIGVVEIHILVAHAAMVHLAVALHTVVHAHAGQRLFAVFLLQRLHPHHVEHRVHHQL